MPHCNLLFLGSLFNGSRFNDFNTLPSVFGIFHRSFTHFGDTNIIKNNITRSPGCLCHLNLQFANISSRKLLQIIFIGFPLRLATTFFLGFEVKYIYLFLFNRKKLICISKANALYIYSSVHSLEKDFSFWQY